MDPSVIDQLARVLGSGISRRAGLSAGLGALASVAAAGAKERNDKGSDKGKERRRGGGPKPEGPCGDGSRRDNACTKGSDCCTGVCALGTSKKNKDGKGRCRCVRKGNECKDDKNCCNAAGGTAVCLNGRCSAPPVATGEPCTSSDTCVDSAAACVAYGTSAPAGTYCLLPAGTACSGDGVCQSAFCNGSTCAATCTVCEEGCPYQTIQAALADTVNVTAGSTVAIAPGSWLTTEKVMTSENGRNLHIRRCGVGGKVEWESTNEVIDLDTTPHSVTSLQLTDIDFTGLGGFGDFFIKAKGNDPSTRLALTITGCSFSGRRYRAIWTRDDLDLVMNQVQFLGNFSPSADGGGLAMIGTGVTLEATKCLFKGNRAGGSGGNDGGGAWIEGQIIGGFNDCQFEDNLATSDGGAIEITTGAVITFTGCSFTGNSTGAGGGAVSIEGAETDVTFTDCVIENNLARGFFGGGGISTNGGVKSVKLLGTTRVTNNRSLSVETPDNAGGIAAGLTEDSAYIPSQRFVGTNASTVYGNRPDQCAVQSWNDGYSDKAWVVVDCATWCLPSGTIVATSKAAACCSGTQTGGVCD